MSASVAGVPGPAAGTRAIASARARIERASRSDARARRRSRSRRGGSWRSSLGRADLDRALLAVGDGAQPRRRDARATQVFVHRVARRAPSARLYSRVPCSSAWPSIDRSDTRGCCCSHSACPSSVAARLRRQRRLVDGEQHPVAHGLLEIGRGGRSRGDADRHRRGPPAPPDRRRPAPAPKRSAFGQAASAEHRPISRASEVFSRWLARACPYRRFVGQWLAPGSGTLVTAASGDQAGSEARPLRSAPAAGCARDVDRVERRRARRRPRVSRVNMMHPAVRRPGRPLVEEGRRQQPLLRAVGAHHADVEAARRSAW